MRNIPRLCIPRQHYLDTLALFVDLTVREIVATRGSLSYRPHSLHSVLIARLLCTSHFSLGCAVRSSMQPLPKIPDYVEVISVARPFLPDHYTPILPVLLLTTTHAQFLPGVRGLQWNSSLDRDRRLLADSNPPGEVLYSSRLRSRNETRR